MSCEHNITFSKYAGIIRDCFAVVATETTHIDQVVNARVIRDLKKNKATARGASKNVWVACFEAA